MPTLKDELSINRNSIIKNISVEESKKKIEFFKNENGELNHYIKKIESILVNILNEIDSKNTSFVCNINNISLPYGIDNNNNDDRYKDIIKMNILQGINTDLKDNLNLTLNVILKVFQELGRIEKRMEELINENNELKSLNVELNSNIQDLRYEINKLSCEKYHLEEQIKEKNVNCNKYKCALNKSIKTMQRLYLENDNFSKEISLLENQLIISKLRVAQHNEELEHIRTLLRYYKNQVNSDYLLSPAIEQMVKVEPCRISMNNNIKENDNNSNNNINKDKKKVNLFHNTSNNRMQSNIGNILSKLLFNSGSNTTNNIRRNKEYNFINKVSTSTSPISSFSSELLCEDYNINDNNKNDNKMNNFDKEETITPIKMNRKHIETLSTSIENKFNKKDSVYIDENLFIDESLLSPLSSNLIIEDKSDINLLDIH